MDCSLADGFTNPQVNTTSQINMASQFLQNISAGAKQALDGITAKFQLPDDRLVQITQRLTEAFSLGLREPSHPVAMMSVGFADCF